MGLCQVLDKFIAWYRYLFFGVIQKLQLLRDFSLTPSVLGEAFCYCTWLFLETSVLFSRKHLESTPSQGGAGDETGVCSFLLQVPRCTVFSQLPYKVLEKTKPTLSQYFVCFILQYVQVLYPNPNNRRIAFELQYIMFLKERAKWHGNRIVRSLKGLF